MFYKQSIQFTGGRNTDDDHASLPKGDFLFAKNCHIGITNEGNQGAVENVKGNTLVTFTLPAGINRCIGKRTDFERKAIVFFMYNSAGNHSIRRYLSETNTVEMIMQDPVLAFRPEKRFRIHSSNIVEEKLYWTNMNLFPCKINMDRAIGYLNRWFFFDNFFVNGGFVGFTSTGLVNPTAAPFTVGQTITIVQDPGFLNPVYNGFATITGVSGTTITTDIPWLSSTPVNGGYIVLSSAYSVINRQVIEAIKYPPKFSPKHIYVIDPTNNTNGLRGYLYQVSYRYIYDDYEKSTWSAYSKISLPPGDESYKGGVLGEMNQNNVLRISVNTGPNMVKKIEIAVRVGNTNDFFKIVSLDKSELGIEDDVTYNYDFTNSSNKIGLDQKDVRRPFDNVPQLSRAQELLSENVIAYGGCTEGYDNVAVKTSFTVRQEALPNQNKLQFDLKRTATFPTGVLGSYTYLNRAFVLDPIVNSDQLQLGDIVTLIITLWDSSSESGVTYRADYEVGTQTNPLVYLKSLIDIQIAANSGVFSGAQIGTSIITNAPGFVGIPAFRIQFLQSSVVGGTPVPGGRIADISWSVEKKIKKYSGFKTGAYHGFGIIYKDRSGRTGTVNEQRGINASQVYVPMPTEQNTFLTNSYRNTIKWGISSPPPEFATHYSWYYTGNKNIIDCTQYIITKIDRNPSADKVAIHLDWLNAHSTRVFGSRVPAFVFDPDNRARIRFITGKIAPPYSIGLGQIINQPLEFEILGVDTVDPNVIYVQDFLFETISPQISEYSLVEIMIPRKEVQADTEFFFEFSEEYEIGNPGTPQAYHKGETVNQGQVIPITTIPVILSSNTLNRFVFGGDQANLFLSLGTFTVVGGPNAGVYTVASANYTGLNTFVYTLEPVPSVSSQGTVTYGTGLPSPAAEGIFRRGDIYHIPRILFTEDYFYTLQIVSITNNSVTVKGNVVDAYNSILPNTSEFITFIRPDGSIVPVDTDFPGMPPTYDSTLKETIIPILFISNALVTSLGTVGTVIINAQGSYAASLVESFSYSDFYESKAYDKGRPNIVDIDTRRKYLNIVRHSKRYLQETKINGLNTFYDESVQFSDRFGPINKIIEVGYTLKVLQDQKCTSVYVGRTVTNLPDGSEQVLGTNVILGTTIPSQDEFGTIHPESVHKHDRYLYYYDFYGARYIRDAANGGEVISDYKMQKYFRDKTDAIEAFGVDDVHVLSQWDEAFQKLLVTFTTLGAQAFGGIGDTIAFHEKVNRWRESYGFIPEEYGRIGQTLISFDDGQLWLHNSNPIYNNFYGSQQQQFIEFVGNIDAEKHQVYGSLAVYSNQVWWSPITGMITIPSHSEYPTGMSSRILKNKFKHKQGCWYAEFSRDANTPNANPATVFVNGRKLSGYIIRIMLANDHSTYVLLDRVIIQSVPSEKSK